MILPTGHNRIRSAEARRRAFTLVELIVVMTMLAIVMAVAAPSLARFFRGRTLDSEARRLLALTRHGQSRAVSEGVPMLLWLDVEERRYGLQEEPGYSDVDTKAVQFVLGEGLQVEGVHLTGTATTSTSGQQPVMRFQPDGGIDESSVEGLRVTDGEGVEVWLARSLNRLNYEIQTNILQNVRR